jgi:hypothetical protein
LIITLPSPAGSELNSIDFDLGSGFIAVLLLNVSVSGSSRTKFCVAPNLNEPRIPGVEGHKLHPSYACGILQSCARLSV